MRTIWKEPLKEAGIFNPVQLPKGAIVRHVDSDARGADPATIWFECDPELEKEERMFFVAGTGKELPPLPGKLAYCGSCKSPGGVFVWHVYELSK